MKGKLFIIESGSDGSGKATQSKKLYKRLLLEKYNVRIVEFPNYNSASSALVKMYLNGDFGKKADDISAYAASTFYAVDRFASYIQDWSTFYKNGGIIIADRYTTSNMVHQASKIDDITLRNAFLDWLWDFEYIKFGLPVPDAVIFLDVPPAHSHRLIENRRNKITGGQDKDIHEADAAYLIKTYENACWVAEKYNWIKIKCANDQGLKAIDVIHEEIYREIKAHIQLK